MRPLVARIFVRCRMPMDPTAGIHTIIPSFSPSIRSASAETHSHSIGRIGVRAVQMCVRAFVSLVFKWLVWRKTIRTTFTLKANTGRDTRVNIIYSFLFNTFLIRLLASFGAVASVLYLCHIHLFSGSRVVLLVVPKSVTHHRITVFRSSRRSICMHDQCLSMRALHGHASESAIFLFWSFSLARAPRGEAVLEDRRLKRLENEWFGRTEMNEFTTFAHLLFVAVKIVRLHSSLDKPCLYFLSIECQDIVFFQFFPFSRCCFAPCRVRTLFRRTIKYTNNMFATKVL